MTLMEDYLRRVRVIVADAAEYVSDAALVEAQRLVEHGEPAEGLCSLAWAITKEGARVPKRLVMDIRSHTAGLVDDEFMPSELEGHAIEAPRDSA